VASEGIGAGGLVRVLDEPTQERGHHGFLPVGCWVEDVEGAEERLKGGKQLVAVRVVKRALFEISLKRRSQEACGFANRVCNHWASTLAKKDARLAPGSGAVEGQEGVEEKVALKLGNVTKVTVIVESGVGAEMGPTAPDSVPFFVCWFLFCVKDDSAIRKARIAKDNTSLGSGQILKPGGGTI
jgi:hypothetical protein